MRVDEAGGDDVAGGVDDARRLAGESRPDGGDAVTFDGDVGLLSRRPAAVERSTASKTAWSSAYSK